MAERFEMSFWNKELHVWFYLMLPMAIVAFPVLFIVDSRYQALAAVPPLLGWGMFYVWRYFHKKKQNECAGER